jgi:hypothetical protein
MAEPISGEALDQIFLEARTIIADLIAPLTRRNCAPLLNKCVWRNYGKE